MTTDSRPEDDPATVYDYEDSLDRRPEEPGDEAALAALLLRGNDWRGVPDPAAASAALASDWLAKVKRDAAVKARTEVVFQIAEQLLVWSYRRTPKGEREAAMWDAAWGVLDWLALTDQFHAHRAEHRARIEASDA
jgi:hypothetical protein